jgi:hypothetical protein
MMATRRALPLNQWLALEDDVARHKAEIAQGFAEARERLLPDAGRPQPTCLRFEYDDRVVKCTMNADGSPHIDIEYRRGHEPWLAGLADLAASGFWESVPWLRRSV